MEKNTQIPPDFSLKSPKPWLKPLLLGFAVVTLAIIFTFDGYQLGQNRSSKQIPMPTTIASPTPEDITDWETYANDVYGYSFRYPKSISITQFENNPPSVKGSTSVLLTNQNSSLEIIPNLLGSGVQVTKTDLIKVGDLLIEKMYTSTNSAITKPVIRNNSSLNFAFKLSDNAQEAKTMDILFNQILSTFKFTW